MKSVKKALSLLLALCLITALLPITAAAVEKITFTVTFKVAGGKWDDGTAENKVIELSRWDNEDLLLYFLESDYPAVGTKPNDGYTTGSWDVGPHEQAVSRDLTFTYTYCELKDRKISPDAQDMEVSDTVWFGQKDANAIAWRVIGTKEEGLSSPAGTVPLLTAGNIAQSKIDDTGNDSNVYSGSTLQAAVNAIADGLSTVEQAAITKRTLTSGSYDGANTDCVAGDAVADALLWPLSTKEADNVDETLRIVDPEHMELDSNSWWLRSPGGDDDFAAYVQPVGNISYTGVVVSGTRGVRPAFFLNMSSVLLASDTDGGKTSADGAIAAVPASNTDEWKLTLHDESRDGFTVTGTATDAVKGGTLSLYYNGAVTGEKEHVSVLVCNSDGTQVLAYGSTAALTDAGKAKGWAEWTLPADLGAGTYQLYVFSEKKNGEHESDLSSAFRPVTLTVTLPKESKPNAAFSATGYDTGTLTNVSAGMKYKINKGAWHDITGDSVSLTELSQYLDPVFESLQIYVYKPGDGINTSDSSDRELWVYRDWTPSLTATQPTEYGGKGSIPTTAAHEFSDDGENWTVCVGARNDLAPGTYYVRAKANGANLTSDPQTIVIKAVQPTPEATFTATGPDTGTLTNVAAGMTYAIDGGAALEITGTTVDLTGLAPCTITIVRPGNGTTTIDSDAQTITVTRAATSELAAAQPAVIDGKGSIPTTEAHELSDDGTTWTACTGETTGLAPNTYYVRVAASGTALASDAQTITINAFDPAKEPTPEAVFTATGPDTGTLTNAAAGMTYRIDNDTAVVITETSVDLTGLVPCAITVIRPGNGTTTVDSDAQTITVTKAATPALTATQPSTIGGTGSIPTTAAHEFSEDGENWTVCVGARNDLAPGTYYVRAKANGANLTSDPQIIVIKAVQPTPEAVFTATGPDTGTLTNVAAGMTYRIDNDTAVVITETSVDLTGLVPCTITVIRPGNGTTTIDSDAQTITVTKAAVPDTVTAEGCTTYLNNNGKLIGVTAAMEYKASDAEAWTAGTGDEVTGLAPGTYLVRVAANGTALTSDAQEVTVADYVAPSSDDDRTPAPVTEIYSGESITSSELDRLISEGKTLTVEAKDGTKVELSNDALKDIAGQTSGSVKLEFTKETPIEGDGTGTAYDLTVSAGGKPADFSGKVTIKPTDADEKPLRTASVKESDGSRHFVVSSKPFPYTDVPAGSYYYDAVNWADLLGITEGVGGNLFDPTGTCTRAQMVTFLWRAAGRPEPTTGSNPFSDLDESAYYYKAVLWAAENGITVGVGGGRFDPDGAVSRSQSVTFLYRALGGKAEGSSTFDDVQIGAYYYNAVLWAAENGITFGTSDTTFSPDDDCLRAQIVTFLYRAYNEE